MLLLQPLAEGLPPLVRVKVIVADCEGLPLPVRELLPHPLEEGEAELPPLPEDSALPLLPRLRVAAPELVALTVLERLAEADCEGLPLPVRETLLQPLAEGENEPPPLPVA